MYYYGDGVRMLWAGQTLPVVHMINAYRILISTRVWKWIWLLMEDSINMELGEMVCQCTPFAYQLNKHS